MIDRKQLTKLKTFLSVTEYNCLKASVESVDKIEKKYLKKVDRFYNNLNFKIVEEMVRTGKLPSVKDLDFLPLLLDHAHAVMQDAIKTTHLDPQVKKKIPKSKLARSPKFKFPTTLEELRKLYDAWRKKKNIPPDQQKMADAVKEAYLKKLQQVYKKFNKPLKQGDIMPREQLIEKILGEMNATKARAQTIVRTETTLYYNNVRRNIYDNVQGVTHYLFIAIRDFRTTPWCDSRQDLVYEKGSEYLKNETPPIHYNCRSEILPLSKYNPSHIRIIENYTHREHASPKPLPEGWVRKHRSKHK